MVRWFLGPVSKRVLEPPDLLRKGGNRPFRRSSGQFGLGIGFFKRKRKFAAQAAQGQWPEAAPKGREWQVSYFKMLTAPTFPQPAMKHHETDGYQLN